MEIVKVYTYPIVVVCTYYCTYSKGFHKYCKRLHFFVDKQKNQWEYTRSIKGTGKIASLDVGTMQNKLARKRNPG
ncbi:hypothetical protein, partial [Sphaerochaeta sp. UBA5849]|uniref:hypothetical protein n=1 Tax=Sphaerochaeta sp. UBA5849 TaxID=1947475 RepID=UPI0031F4C642